MGSQEAKLAQKKNFRSQLLQRDICHVRYSRRPDSLSTAYYLSFQVLFSSSTHLEAMG